MSAMRVSVLFTTYNSVDWLQKVLWGYEQQSHTDFDILIADDGSGPETAEMIERCRRETGLSIRHLWHEDNGFQKCRILNKAIMNVESEYIVFTDGDCIPRKDFLAVHVERSQPGYFLSGGYCKLPLSTSQQITRDDIVNARCFDYDWLRANGMPAGRKNLKLKTSPARAQLYNRLTPTRCNLKGSNASAWTADVLRVNGFDERMQWGGLDREFGVRLENAGVKARHVRYDAIVVHLDHGRGYKDPAMVAANKALRVGVAKQGIVTTEHGISQLADEGYKAGDGLLS